MSKIIQFWFAAVLFIVSGVSAKDVTEEDIKKGSVKMYTQIRQRNTFLKTKSLFLRSKFI